MRMLLVACRVFGAMACAAVMLCMPAPAASQTERDQCADVHNRDAIDRNIAACTRIIDERREPDHAAALGNRCGLWITKGNFDRAIADCDDAIRLDPKGADAYLNRGNAHAARRDYDRAITDFDAAIRLNPALAMAYNNRGVVRRNKGDIAGAIADYGEAIGLAPNLAMAYRNRGRALRNGDEFDQAIADFDAAIRLDPNDAGSFGSRCWARAVAAHPAARQLAILGCYLASGIVLLTASHSAPTMTYYHGSTAHQFVFTGFSIWSYARQDCIGLVDFVLQDLWGLPRQNIDRGSIAPAIRNGVSPPVRGVSPAQRTVSARVPSGATRE